jgi:filamin
MIEVDARTLKIGILGEDVKTVIDARKASAGHLSAQCEGPSQLEYCELYDNRDGTYILRVTPKVRLSNIPFNNWQELGRHILSIKYGEEHVRGSPFVFNVSNPPDASKVKVYGPGIEHGILAT